MAQLNSLSQFSENHEDRLHRLIDSTLTRNFTSRDEFIYAINQLCDQAIEEMPSIKNKIELIREQVIAEFDLISAAEVKHREEISRITKELLLEAISEENNLEQNN